MGQYNLIKAQDPQISFLLKSESGSEKKNSQAALQ